MSDSALNHFRAPKSWGLAGLLAPQAIVLYQPLASAESVGRISDLLAAKLPLEEMQDALTELAMRLALLRATFIAFSQMSARSLVTLELGFESNTTGISIAFVAENELTLDQVRAALGELHAALVVKWQPSTRRCEINFLFGWPNQYECAEWIELDAASPNAPHPAQYLSLSELIVMPPLQDWQKGTRWERFLHFLGLGRMRVRKPVSLELPQAPQPRNLLAGAHEADVNPASPAPVTPPPFTGLNAPSESPGEQSPEKILGQVLSLVSDPQAKVLIQDSVQSLEAERAELKRQMAKLALDYQLREQTILKKQEELARELKDREEKLKQRAIAVANLQDQVASANIEIERLRSGKVRSEDSPSEARIAQLNRELTAAKAMSQNLMARLSEAKGESAGGRAGGDFKGKAEVEDLKKKLNQANRILSNHKKDTERLNALIEESRQQNQALKAELAKAQVALSKGNSKVNRRVG